MNPIDIEAEMLSDPTLIYISHHEGRVSAQDKYGLTDFEVKKLRGVVLMEKDLETPIGSAADDVVYDDRRLNKWVTNLRQSHKADG